MWHVIWWGEIWNTWYDNSNILNGNITIHSIISSNTVSEDGIPYLTSPHHIAQQCTPSYVWYFTTLYHDITYSKHIAFHNNTFHHTPSNCWILVLSCGQLQYGILSTVIVISLNACILILSMYGISWYGVVKYMNIICIIVTCDMMRWGEIWNTILWHGIRAYDRMCCDISIQYIAIIIPCHRMVFHISPHHITCHDSPHVL